MTSRLEGTVALVTGASSGIGEATAQQLAAEGAAVVVLARRADRLQALADRITSDGGRVLTIEADVTLESQVNSAVDRAASEFGRLDTVVANAGLMLLGPLADADTDEWRQMIELNVLGLMYTAHAALPHLLSCAGREPRRVADLVLVSSVAGRVARAGSGAYNATKHAVGAFGEALRQEVTERHVRVSLVEPGAVDTELAGHNRPEIQAGMRARFGDIQRLAATDISDAITYIVTRPRHTAINEMLIRPTQQVG
ncbi:MAG: SDR family NAD(P)-dependent oxidoreductase [Actinomycetota bacterium]|nr:SDR family NAD(P)-dependent oxidoreductase [Actinomycetota bacterium]